MADDDPDDIRLAKEALLQNDLPVELTYVHDGQDLLDILRASGKYSGKGRMLPHLILLDLNMRPRDGRSALKELKSDPELTAIPVVIYTTSDSPPDIYDAYSLGANCYITKPFSFVELTNTFDMLVRFWMNYAKLPLA
jgi:two-component system response regulator